MYLQQNIKTLRKNCGLSQQELADRLNIPRSSLSDYERGHTQVGLDTLVKISQIFDTTIDDLIKSNLQQRQLEILKTPTLKILAISVDADNKSHIDLVETKAAAGYLSEYSNPEYIKELPKILLPNIPDGTYRAFEITGDSMLPITSGSIIICNYIESLQYVKNDKTYIIITKSEGVVYKRVKKDLDNNMLILISDNDFYNPIPLPLDEIEEIWQYHAHIVFSDKKQKITHIVEENLQHIRHKLNAIHEDVTLLVQKK